ncbi:hypothetical protein DMUE_6225 [Dictyocoela muelleri]|nr:hypothetical protein DMUE_6225 [Dictyocoela muelleri]
MTKVCNKCNGKMNMKFYKHWIYKCTKKSCRFQHSVLKFTPFYYTHLKFSTIINIIILFYKGKNIFEISQNVSVSNSSVLKILTKVSNFIYYKYLRSIEKLGGENKIVEVDESLLVKRKYNRGRIIKEIWIFGMIERGSKKIIFIPITKRNKYQLGFLSLLSIKKNTIIYSDCWRGYTNLNNLGFEHKTVNHSRNFVEPSSGVHTNTIEANWSALKRTIPIQHKRSKFLKIYLLRFMLKRNEGDDFLIKIIELILN